MKTRREAELKRREIVKDCVRRYFKSEDEAGIEFNWEEYGSNIIKKELYSYYSDIIVSWDFMIKEWVVIGNGYLYAK